MENNSRKNKLMEIINNIPVTSNNKKMIEDIKKSIEEDKLEVALEKLNVLSKIGEEKKTIDETVNNEEKNNILYKYPKELSNIELEYIYMGLLLQNPEAIAKYYFTIKEISFENTIILNLYKRVLFTDGQAYAPESAKKGFNFAKVNAETLKLEKVLKRQIDAKKFDIEEIYIELKKLFVIRRSYREIPIKKMQDKIIDILNYKLYDKMSVEEVESAVQQVNDTAKFKSAVLNEGLTDFLELQENNLKNGLSLPFPIISSVFKGIRKGETMSYAMPSNAGKSRFAINLAAYTCYIHKKKVLVISNEMSEEKMKLCLITTIVNNPDIQKLHGQKISVTEGELLEFKFRPDDPKKVKVDENGYCVKEKGETQAEFVKRLLKVSSIFKSVIKATDWVKTQVENSIYFINITDHTNDELKKVIMNYYYKEHIEYVFYDTLKTDTANIGKEHEIKITATMLSNLAQNFNIFICSSLQLAESATSPLNLDVNDLAVSRTVKEVLDTLCLIKQIHRDNLADYEYSLNEVDTKFYDLKKYEDPDVRYYACVIDKNRAGAKPTVVFRLNLAYNSWEELGYLRLKQPKRD